MQKVNKRDLAKASAIVIGAGMTGLGVAIKLKEAGIGRLLVLEKGDRVGGTWRENTYPGVACDVPAHAYTYSFAPNPDWSGLFAPGNEIQAYFEGVFREFGIDAHTRFGQRVTASTYENGQWHVTTEAGETHSADFLFAATGMLHRPVTPDFQGRECFAGAQFHSAEWDHSVELKGKRIAVVGNGSSAAQLIPHLVDTEDTEITVFQRTPQWMVEVPNRAYSDEQRRRFRENPALIERSRYWSLLIFEKGTTALTSQAWFDRLAHRMMSWNGRRYLRKAVKDPALRQKLTPDYTFGCKRVVMNATFYPALQKPNCHLETAAIAGIEAEGIRDVDGRLHPADVIVYATGFDPFAYMRPMDFRGREGVSIGDVWQRKVQAYKSLFVPGFPNFFLMLGPNSPIGNYSVIAITEAQTDYALQVLEGWESGRIQDIEAQASAMQEWNNSLKQRMKNTVWASGCQSWYLDADGDPLTWPDTWPEFLKTLQEPVWADFMAADVSAASTAQL